MDTIKFPFKIASGLAVCEPVFSHNININFFVFDSIKNIEIARNSEYVDMIVGRVSTSIPIYFILVKFNKDLIYDCWLNYCAPEGKGKYIFDALSKQDFIYLHFYSEEGYVCTIREINKGRDVFKNIKQEIERNIPLSRSTLSFAAKEVARTKAAVMREFKDKNDFWEKLIQQ
jgi:hypothetical protein